MSFKSLYFIIDYVYKKLYNYSTCRTNRVLTRSVRRVRVYAFGAPTTHLRV